MMILIGSFFLGQNIFTNTLFANAACTSNLCSVFMVKTQRFTIIQTMDKITFCVCKRSNSMMRSRQPRKVLTHKPCIRFPNTAKFAKEHGVWYFYETGGSPDVVYHCDGKPRGADRSPAVH